MKKRDDHDKDVEMPQSTDVEQGRRDFLKGSVAAAGVGLAAGAAPGLAAAAAESDAKAAADGMTRLKVSFRQGCVAADSPDRVGRLSG